MITFTITTEAIKIAAIVALVAPFVFIMRDEISAVLTLPAGLFYHHKAKKFFKKNPLERYYRSRFGNFENPEMRKAEKEVFEVNAEDLYQAVLKMDILVEAIGVHKTRYILKSYLEGGVADDVFRDDNGARCNEWDKGSNLTIN